MPPIHPVGTYLTPKYDELISVHDTASLKKYSVFVTPAFENVRNICPSFSQFTTFSKLPYHFLKNPPILHGNHLKFV